LFKDYAQLRSDHKKSSPNNKKVNAYYLTEKGLSISPIVYDLKTWSDNYLRDYDADMTSFDQPSVSQLPREEAILEIQEHYVASVLLDVY
tara:strand:- start:461 stop:730 length:270 start_codon:yes stop_codon:yes gene_type:complete